ncbi:MAG: putative AlkP superfamily pyrophosphatase or phosphodiesterase [Candidatus Azotimanducaceae bacterium]|jgi:predicted AlkP superfamily pyrophosphatase or phosphodiesterase
MILRLVSYTVVFTLFSAIFVKSTFSEELSSSILTTPSPKLIVVISVDQLRRDRINSKMPGFLGELFREGRVYSDADLDHGISTTCGGHATILTGMAPGPAGIPGNTYIDQNFEMRYCVDDDNDKYMVIGGDVNRSPRNLISSTFGQWLKEANPASKVFSVGGKDRATITMAGDNADGVYWFDNSNGFFTTSGYYADELPEFIKQFNGEDPLVDGYLKGISETWVHGEGSLRIDDYEGEVEDFSRQSGHPLRIASEDHNVFEQIYRSPEIDTATLKLADIIIKEEQLGKGLSPDLLIIALSAIDTVGHLYGPRSAESEATLANIDLLLKSFVTRLESDLGKDNILLVLSSDHGVAELPEYMTEMGRNACPEQGRIAAWPLLLNAYASAYWHFTGPFDHPSELIKFGGSGFSFNLNYIQDKSLNIDEVITTMDDALSQIDIVKSVWTQNEIREGTSEVSRLLRNSLSVKNSPDLLLQLHKDCVITLGGGTTHGSVYSYDRDIPIIFYGKGILPGHIKGRANSVDIAPSLASHIGIGFPTSLNGRVLILGE